MHLKSHPIPGSRLSNLLWTTALGLTLNCGCVSAILEWLHVPNVSSFHYELRRAGAFKKFCIVLMPLSTVWGPLGLSLNTRR